MDLFQFGRIVGCSIDTARTWHPHVMHMFEKQKIDTKLRRAAYLAQSGHESGGFNDFEENLNYGAQALMRCWPSRFQTLEKAKYYANIPERIANFVYGGRFGNGAYESGDGWRYRGRGPFQITFADNYRLCGKALNLPLIEQPELLLIPETGAMSSGWYWNWKGLNAVADTGNIDAVSDVINLGKQTAKYGDSNGFPDRKERYERALAIL